MSNLKLIKSPYTEISEKQSISLQNIRYIILNEKEITQSTSKTYTNVGIDEKNVVRKIRIGSSLQKFSQQIIPSLPQIPSLFPNLFQLALKISVLKDIPKEFMNLNQLKDFGCYCPQLNMFPSNFFHNLRNLERIDIQSECISVIPSLENQDKLEILLITKMPKLQSLPQSIGTSKFIRVFRLKNTGVEIIPKVISNWKDVQEIEIQSCPNLHTLPDVFDQLSNLKILTIEKCEGLLSVPPSLQRCPSLQKLKLLECKNIVLTNQDIEAFDQLALFLFDGKTIRAQGHMQLPDGARLQVHPFGEMIHQLERELGYEVLGVDEKTKQIIARGEDGHIQRFDIEEE